MNYFPTPYEDELLYSTLARFSMRSGNIRDIHNFEDLFGTRSCVAVMELATNLDALINNLPVNSKYTADFFIYNHTLFPFLGAFTDEDRANKIVANMRIGNGSVPYISIGLVSSSLSLNQYFRFCPECLQEDIEVYGEPYWHRQHQATGVFVCAKHKVPIYNSKELVRGGNRQRYINASIDNCVVDEDIRYSEELIKKMIIMAKDIELLLNKRFEHKSQEWFKDQFRVKLIEKGYARMNNYIHHKKLKTDFIDFYGKDYLQLLQCDVSETGYSWLSTIVRNNNRTMHPIRYLLLARFLDIKLEDLFNTDFKNPYIDDGDEINSINLYQEIWDQRLEDLCQMGLSIREIAATLESTPKTIRRHIDRLGIAPFWKYNGGGQFIGKKYTETEKFKQKREDSRAKWLKLLNDNPEKSGNQIRKNSEGLYTWLSRYDGEWLHDNYPIIRHKSSNIVDWEKRDAELLPRVKAVVEEMKRGKPQRITWSTVGSRLGVSGWLSKRRDKMPMVKAYLESQIESLKEFQMRKIVWAVKKLDQEGKELTLWNVVETAGVKPRYMDTMEEIYNILNLIENKLNFNKIYEDVLISGIIE